MSQFLYSKLFIKCFQCFISPAKETIRMISSIEYSTAQPEGDNENVLLLFLNIKYRYSTVQYRYRTFFVLQIGMNQWLQKHIIVFQAVNYMFFKHNYITSIADINIILRSPLSIAAYWVDFRVGSDIR